MVPLSKCLYGSVASGKIAFFFFFFWKSRRGLMLFQLVNDRLSNY